MTTRIAFIINPISGNKSKRNIKELILQRLDQTIYAPEFFYTERRNHATEITRELLAKNVLRIVAVGGDGTINEVAKSMIHTEGILGIIPSGSGNGLARHLEIPMSAAKAIDLLNKNYFIHMDTAAMNDHPFFCTSGMGFDAYVGKLFAQKATRGFQTYIKTTLMEFIHYKAHEYTITYGQQEISTKAFLITVGNTSQYGNNAFICPYADVQDGLLDVSIITPFSKIFAFDLGRRLFNRTIDKSRYARIFQTTELKIVRKEPGPVHIDGEPMELGEELRLKIKPSSLKVMVLPK